MTTAAIGPSADGLFRSPILNCGHSKQGSPLLHRDRRGALLESQPAMPLAQGSDELSRTEDRRDQDAV